MSIFRPSASKPGQSYGVMYCLLIIVIVVMQDHPHPETPLTIDPPHHETPPPDLAPNPDMTCLCKR